MAKQLFLSDSNKKVAGVCGGIAEYFDIDPVIVRLCWLILILCLGTGIIAYLIAWIIIPRKNSI
ncbi:MAG: PspC domain-containing protein [Bacteroidales bacterium]|nr:PspC domain-containing protein [Bacteroidales bacterium]